MSFAARFAGECPECGGRIELGDQLVFVEELGYAHEACPDALPEKSTKFQGTSLEEMGF